MSELEQQFYSLASFLKKSENAIITLNQEKDKNMKVLDHDINLIGSKKDISLGDFKSIKSNNNDYKPNSEELANLKKTFKKQKEMIKNVYNTKIKSQEDYTQRVKDIYSDNGLNIMNELATFTKDLF